MWGNRPGSKLLTLASLIILDRSWDKELVDDANLNNINIHENIP